MSTSAVDSEVDNRQVSNHWDQQFVKNRVDKSNWANNNLIGQHLSHLITSGSQNHWLIWLLQDYLRDIQQFNRSLSICCGDGAHELMLYNSNKVKLVTGFDISEGALRQATEKFAQAGAPASAYQFEVNDANNLVLRDCYDLILSTGALHHVTELEDLLNKVNDHLNPDGYFVLLEFVGPNRFQWTQRQCDVINGVLAQLDPQYLNGGVRPAFSPPPIEEMLRIDPSEAVRAEEIVPLVRERFHVEYERQFNGTLIHLLFPHLNFSLSNENQGDFDSIVRLLLYFEDVLVQNRILTSDFVFMILRRRGDDKPKTSRGLVSPHCTGHLDECTASKITGWAADPGQPSTTLFVNIDVDGNRVGRVFCDTWRPDVRKAGFGNGLCGFTYHFSPSCKPAPGSRVEVFVSGTRTLIGSGIIPNDE